MRNRMKSATTAEFTEHINFGLTPDLRLRIQKIARRSGEKEGATVRRLVREAVEREEERQREAVPA